MLRRVTVGALRRDCLTATHAAVSIGRSRRWRTGRAPPGPHPSRSLRPGHGGADPERYFRDDDDRGGDRAPARHADRQEGHTQQTDPQEQRQAHENDTREGPAASGGESVRSTGARTS